MAGDSLLVSCKRAKLGKEEEAAEGETLYLNMPPDHICELILGKLKPFSKDYFRFGCVCKQWFSILMQDRQRRRRLNHTHDLVPMMVLPTSRHSNGVVKVVVNSLFSVTDKTIIDGVNLRLTYDVTADDIVNYCGSTYGWLCYFVKSYEIVMYNPFAAVDNVIRLPPIMHAFQNMPCSMTEKHLFRCWLDFFSIPSNLGFQYAVRKVVLSADPRTTDDYLVVAIYGGCDRLAFFSNNANASSSNFPSWTYFDEGQEWGQFSDVIFHQGLVYACDRRHVVVIKVETNDDCLPVFQVCAKIDKSTIDGVSLSPCVWYLTETTSRKELLLIVKLLRLKPDHSHSIRMFRVFKLTRQHEEEEEEEELRWVNQTSLDGDAVFVGFSHTISVVASASTGCLPDSIYFTDDYPYISRDFGPYGSLGPCNIGIFNLNDKSKCKRYSRVPSFEQLPMPPIWILPMF